MTVLGQIGLGTWGQNHARVFSALKDCRLKICCDTNRETLRKFGSLYGKRIKLTDKFEEILNDKETEAVVITTPAITHSRLAIKALSAGKHIFVEKPLALSLEEGKRIMALAERKKRIVMVGHLLLYHPAIITLKNYISRGELGKIFYLYSMRVNLNEKKDKESVLWNLASHDISLALFLLKNTPEEITASGHSYLRKNIEDVIFATIKFQDNIYLQITASYLNQHKVRKITVVGSKKTAVFDDLKKTGKIRIYTKNKKIPGGREIIRIPRLREEEPLKNECRHFIERIRHGIPPRFNEKNELAVLWILAAAQESLKANGARIKLKSRDKEN